MIHQVRVYDIPTRIFHWAFAFFFVFAFFIGKTVDDESLTFSYHMMAGIMLSALVILRLIWGFVGSRYARFQSFPLHPKELIQYFQDLFKGGAKRFTGHNPASSWAGLAMLFLALGLGVTGYLMVNGYKESLEDIHEVLSTVFVLVAVAHVVGIIFHTIRHKDPIGLSMIHGSKQVDQVTEQGISNSHSFVGVLLVLILGYLAFSISKGFDPQTRVLSLFGQTLQLGENEKSEKEDESSLQNIQQSQGSEKPALKKDDDGDDD
jgi:cytochrome b